MNKNESKKQSILLSINAIIAIISFLIYGYSLVITSMAKNYDKTKNPFNGSIYNSQYCEFIKSKIDYNHIMIFAGIVLVAYIVMIIINIVKKEKALGKLIIGLIISTILCFSASAKISNCNGLDDTWDNIEGPKIELNE